MKISEVRELTDKELVDRLAAERETLVRMKINHSISPLDNPGEIRETRKTVARLYTELRSRELKQQ